MTEFLTNLNDTEPALAAGFVFLVVAAAGYCIGILRITMRSRAQRELDQKCRLARPERRLY